jgi:tRNA (guanine37-N1)-methyltransferase
MEAVARLLPEALGDAGAVERDSFSDGMLDHPHYTRPEVFEGMAVPAVLLSGDHAAIERWRREMSQRATRVKRPDLLAGGAGAGSGPDAAGAPEDNDAPTARAERPAGAPRGRS